VGLEAATFISDFTTTNPISTDVVSQGDDHVRLLKTVLKATFPNATKAFYFPDTAAKSADFTIVATDLNKTFLVTTTGGNVAATLPSLASGDAGWFCYIIKVTTDANAVFITPASGTIQSGAVASLAKTRRAIPGIPSRVWWTGSAWFAERAEKAPVGAIIDFDGATVPVGYELPNGQTLSGTAGSVYPDYYAVKGGLTTRDVTGRVIAMKEASATRLTTAGGGVDGATLGAAGGGETHTLTTAELAAHTHIASSNVTDPGHAHTLGAGGGGGNLQNGGTIITTSGAGSVASATTGISVATTNANAGSGTAHANVQPTIVLNKLLVVE